MTRSPEEKAKYKHEWYLKNKERLQKINKQYRETHSIEIKLHKKISYNNNKEIILIKGKLYREKNKDKIQIQKKMYRKTNKIKIQERKRNYRNRKKEMIYKRDHLYRYKRRKLDITYNLSCRIRHRIKQSLAGIFAGKNITSRTREILGCSPKDLIMILGTRPEGDYHLDHIVPCALAKTEEELIKLQHYSNFQWLSAEENLSKGSKITVKGCILCVTLLGRQWYE